ncbi:MAG: response regulator [Melioribacteraceae bacterium]|nr:response regulator [Melioribacteraceae bacterium]
MPNELIIIIDDEYPVLDVLQIMIKKFGYRTESFKSAGDSLGRIQHGKPDMVILDYSIPGENGKKNIKTILNINPDIKILLLSGLDMSQCDEFKKLGVADCLQKPIKMELLEDYIKLNLAK